MSKEVNQVPACLFQLPNLPDYVLRFQDEQTQVLDKHLQLLLGRHLSTDYHLESIAQELIFRLQNPAAEAGTTVLSEVQRLYSQEQMRAFVDWFPFDYIGEQVDISDVIEDFRGVARIERTT